MQEANDVKRPDGYFSCPVRRTLSMISGKWKLLIVKELFDGPVRFNELKRRVGKVSQRLLTAELRALEEVGLVAREIMQVMPPHVEYSLTPKGQSLKDVVDVLASWGEKEIQSDKALAGAD